MNYFLYRLHMNTDMGSPAEALFQGAFNGCCRTVRLLQCNVAVHAHMHFYRIIAAYTAGTQMVRRTHSGKRKDNFCISLSTSAGNDFSNSSSTQGTNNFMATFMMKKLTTTAAIGSSTRQ